MDNITNTKLKKCGNCMVVYYCSTGCQKEHWHTHKLVCNKEETVSICNKEETVSICNKEENYNKETEIISEIEKVEAKEAEECPICFEVIHETINRTITECGHQFHASCLIKHTILTNMGCPLCRYLLADIPEEEFTDSDSDTDSSTSTSTYTSNGSHLEVASILNELEPPDTDENGEEIVVEKRTINEILTEMRNRDITEKHLVSTLISLIYEQSSMDRLFILDERDSDMECEVFDILG